MDRFHGTDYYFRGSVEEERHITFHSFTKCIRDYIPDRVMNKKANKFQNGVQNGVLNGVQNGHSVIGHEKEL